ncbi:MAG: DUF2142 domain-containing protein [Streptococcaceae bacterium]|nr:DUF2142 domain-containing protein [Streptococcaceae bacterium]
MTTVKKAFTELLKNWKLALLLFVTLIVGQFAIQYMPTAFPKLYLILGTLAILGVLLLVRFKEPAKLARNTVIILVLFGGVNSLTLPVSFDMDEPVHMMASMQLADGRLTWSDNGTAFDKASTVYSDVAGLAVPGKRINLYSEKFRSIKNQPTNYADFTAQKPVNPAYIPSALGIVLGRLISPHFFVAFYLGRLFNLLTFALFVFFAIKISKKYKLAIVLMSMLPFTLWVTAGYNYDSFYYGLTLLLIAQLTNFFSKETLISKKSMLWYALTCAALVFVKAPVMLLIIVPLFLPATHFVSERIKRWSIFVTAAFAFLGALWIGQKSILKLFGHAATQVATTAGVEKVSRVQYYLQHPKNGLALILRSLWDIPANTFNSLIEPHQWITHGSGGAYLINIVIMTLAMLFVSAHLAFKVTKKMKLVLSVILFLIAGAIIYAISGDSRVFHVGDLNVGGVQGRYYYFILAFLPLLIAEPVKKLFNTQALEKKLYKVSSQEMLVKMLLFMTFLNTVIGIYTYL